MPAIPEIIARKVTQKSGSQPARSLNTTPAVNTETESESDNVSAFERAGALKLPNEPKDEPKSAFDRAGNAIGSDDSDESSAEPSPDE